MRCLRVRSVAFVVMLCTAFLAIQAELLASFSQPLSEFCDSWEDQEFYDCTECDLGTGHSPGWGANGECDFSGIEDEQERLFTAAAYVTDAGWSCDATCDDDYAEYVADWYYDLGNPFDPCYEAQSDPECWITWGSAGGEAGTVSNWSCSCQRFFQCAC